MKANHEGVIGYDGKVCNSLSCWCRISIESAKNERMTAAAMNIAPKALTSNEQVVSVDDLAWMIDICDSQFRMYGDNPSLHDPRWYGGVRLACLEIQRRRAAETGGYPEYTNAIGDAGYRYMQRCDGRTSSGMFYWHELWDALNAAAYQSPVKSSCDRTRPLADMLAEHKADPSKAPQIEEARANIEKQEPLT